MSNDEYWPYARAMTELKRRLQATDEEIRMWVFIGSADGGLDAFDAPHRHEKGSPPRLHFTAPVVGAYFQREQIESFSPDTSRRYINGPQLLGRWAGHGLPQHEALLGQLIDQGDLQPIVLVRTEHDMQTHERDGVLSSLALFALDQVIDIEVREFSGMQMVVDALSGRACGAEIGVFSNEENACENPHLRHPVSACQPIPRRINKLGGRTHILTSIIDDLLKNSTNPERAAVVFTEMVALTNSTSRPPLLLGFDSEKKAVMYRKTDGEVGYFNRRNLDDLLRRKNKRAKKQPH